MLAIVAVVITHAGVRKRADEYGIWDVVLRTRWVSYHVPVFLLASGFLYFRATPISLRETGARLARILIPYLGVSIAIQIFPALVGQDRPFDLARAGFEIATGSSIGIYYYVFLIFVMTPLVWPLSRAPRRVVLGLAIAVFGYAVAALIEPRILLDQSPFTIARNPFNFWLGYLLTGWVVAAYAEELSAFTTRHRRACLAVCTTAAVSYLAYYYAPLLGVDLPSSQGRRLAMGLLRGQYALAFAGAVAIVVARWPVPRWVRFLSEASFSLFLYHRLFMFQLLPYTLDWPAPVRIGILALFGLGAASLLCLSGRRLLGDRSRLLLGY